MGKRTVFVLGVLVALTSAKSVQATCNTTFTPPALGASIDILTAGANCNTTCNDTTIFQSALTFLKANGGGEILLPAGKTCSVNISIDPSSAGLGVAIIGRGRESSILSPYNGATQ